MLLLPPSVLLLVRDRLGNLFRLGATAARYDNH